MHTLQFSNNVPATHMYRFWREKTSTMRCRDSLSMLSCKKLQKSHKICGSITNRQNRRKIASAKSRFSPGTAKQNNDNTKILIVKPKVGSEIPLLPRKVADWVLVGQSLRAVAFLRMWSISVETCGNRNVWK